MAETNDTITLNDNNSSTLYRAGYVWFKKGGAWYRVALKDMVGPRASKVPPTKILGAPAAAVLADDVLDHVQDLADGLDDREAGKMWPAMIWGSFVGVPVDAAQTQWDAIDLDRAVEELERGEALTVRRLYGQVTDGVRWRHTIDDVFAERLDGAICAALGLKMDTGDDTIDDVEVVFQSVRTEERYVVRVQARTDSTTGRCAVRCPVPNTDDGAWVELWADDLDAALGDLKAVVASRLWAQEG